MLPVGTNLKRCRYADTGACFHCHEEETHSHIIQCPNPGIQMTFDSLLEDIHEWMLQLTSDTIADNLISIARYRTLNGGHNQLRALSKRA